MEIQMKKQMKHRKLGSLSVSEIGYGAMGLSHGYGPTPSHEESIRLLRKCYEEGCDFFDTAEGYGQGENEKLVGEALEPIRNKVIIATKFICFGSEHPNLLKEIEDKLDNSLKNLKTNYVDLYYLHRVNKDIPIEDIAKVMGELIKKGKIKGWGMSQVNSEQIRKAHAITPLTAIQNEYSIMERMFEKNVIPTCKELGIGFVPFSPMASGFLSGKYNKDTVYKGDDVRLAITRFDKDNVVKNQLLLDTLKKVADNKKCTLAQISLAWILRKGDFIVPIPGMRTDERIIENFGAANVQLSDDEFNEIEKLLAQIPIHGNRTDEAIIAMGHVKSIPVQVEK
jgi:aryl-alcohol dehydrogenase-like predicted oxidoreductase